MREGEGPVRPDLGKLGQRRNLSRPAK
jgi:hypothetical protein